VNFSAQVGTSLSMPGNIALGQSQSEGGGTGGQGPGVQVSHASQPGGRATVSLPQGRASSPKPQR
jgi:hypothetical protein